MYYRNFSSYVRERYHGKIKKMCIDGGFTCPNRDGTCGTGGCIFCGEKGAGEHMVCAVRPIPEQVERYFAHKHKADVFVCYFQNFTNTYAPADVLRERYDSALADDRIVALAVGTRPDCIDEEKAQLLASYKDRLDVWAELGLQTSDDHTAEIINRGYRSERFREAAKLLNRYNIPVVAHIMIGLPGEGMDELRETVRFLNTCPIWGIKIHSIFVMKNTVLEDMYLNGSFAPPSMDEYAEAAAYVLAHIHPDIIVMRLTGDCPKEHLTAPQWNPLKDDTIAAINRKMAENGWVQGCLYEEEE